MITDVTELERRIERALHERADSLDASTVVVHDTEPSVVRRRPWRALLVAAAVVAVPVLVVALTRPFSGGVHRPSGPTDTTLPVASTTTVPPPPAGVVGPEVPLHDADTFDTRHLILVTKKRDPTSNPIAVQIPGYAPVVVNGPNMIIAYAPPDGTGYQGAGTSEANAATRIVGTTDTGANESSPTKNTYGVWTTVPEGTAYVTITNGDDQAWQRPLHGISYFAVHGGVPAGPVVFRAYNAAGQQIGEARP